MKVGIGGVLMQGNYWNKGFIYICQVKFKNRQEEWVEINEVVALLR